VAVVITLNATVLQDHCWHFSHYDGQMTDHSSEHRRKLCRPNLQAEHHGQHPKSGSGTNVRSSVQHREKDGCLTQLGNAKTGAHGVE
jgi:hypothetical protein